MCLFSNYQTHRDIYLKSEIIHAKFVRKMLKNDNKNNNNSNNKITIIAHMGGLLSTFYEHKNYSSLGEPLY